LKGEPGRAADELEEYLRKTPSAANAAQVNEQVMIKTVSGGFCFLGRDGWQLTIKTGIFLHRLRKRRMTSRCRSSRPR
jgi:hypothetical protein